MKNKFTYLLLPVLIACGAWREPSIEELIAAGDTGCYCN
jgi:hypothetical protein